MYHKSHWSTKITRYEIAKTKFKSAFTNNKMKLAIALAFIVLSSTETHAQVTVDCPTEVWFQNPKTFFNKKEKDDDPKKYKKKDCAWLTYTEKRRQNKCSKPPSVNFPNKKNKAQLHCPSSCGRCCEDDPTYQFKNDQLKKVGCTWIATNPLKRSEYCERKKVKGHCMLACDNCQAPIANPDDDVSTNPVAPPVGPPVTLDDD